jgi:solute:Na+ symporter, SSS family
MHDVITALTVAYDLLVGGLLVPTLAAMLWRSSSAIAALSSIAAGSIVVLVLLALAGLDSELPIYGGLGASLLTYMIAAGSTQVASLRSDAAHE